MLEQAIKCCDVSIMPKTKKELEEKYDKIKKETENMRIQLNGGGSCAHENNTGMYRMQES